MFQCLHERLQLPLHQLGPDHLPVVQLAPALHPLRRRHRLGPTEAARWEPEWFWIFCFNVGGFFSVLWKLNRIFGKIWNSDKDFNDPQSCSQIMVDKSVSAQCWQIPTIYADLLCSAVSDFHSPSEESDEWRKLTELSTEMAATVSGAQPSSSSDDKFLLLN